MNVNLLRRHLFNRPAAPAIVSAVVAILLYAITLGGTYIYDDVGIVRDDPRVRNVSQWHRLWTSDYFDGGADNLYRPLVSSSYAVEWFVHGDRPWMFHLVNVLLHAAACAAVAEFTRRGLNAIPAKVRDLSHPDESQPTTAAYFAGTLFAAHPLHVEAVANIVGRAELMCTLAVFVGLAVLLHHTFTNGRAIVVLTVGVLGLLCKEQGILQPLFWVGCVWFLVRPEKTDGRPETKARRSALSLLAVTTLWTWATYLLVREHFLKFEWNVAALDPTRQPMLLGLGRDRILMPAVLLGHYAQLFVWPARLSLDYGGDVIGSHARISDPHFFAGVLAATGWFGAVVFTLKRDARFVAFCLLSAAVTYGLVGNVVTLIGTNFAERLMYLPSAFVLCAVAVCVARVPGRSRSIGLCFVLGLMSLKTVSTAADWNNPLTLYQNSLRATPKSVAVHLLLAREYRARGNVPAADATLSAVCDLYPNYWRVWMFRSTAAMDDGDLRTAQQHLTHAIKLEANLELLGVQDRLQKLQAAAATRPSR